MFLRTSSRRRIVIAAVLAAAGTLLGTAAAQNNAAPKQPDKLGLGESEVKQLLLLMDADRDGRISRKEYMDFMAAEFDRLDKDKNGYLDVKELTDSRLRPSRFAGR
jgi:hypothetical protein